MVIIEVKNEPLDRALRRYKKTLDKRKILSQYRDHQFYKKKSVKRKSVIKHAIYRQRVLTQEKCSIASINDTNKALRKPRWR